MSPNILTTMRDLQDAARHHRFEPVGAVTATDIQNAIQQVSAAAAAAAAEAQPSPTSVTTATYTALPTDRILEVNYAGNVAITLGPTSARAGLDLQIKDISGGLIAGPYAITATPDAADTNGIDGKATIALATDYEAFLLRPVASALAWRVGP